MKKLTLVLALGLLSVALGTAQAQNGPAPAFPSLSGMMGKLFGDNLAFSSGIEMQSTGADGNPITVPAKISFDHGNVRFDMNLADIKGAAVPPTAIAQMKSMGLDQMSMVTRVDQMKGYVIYPNAQSYLAKHVSGADVQTNLSDVKMETTQIGKETIDGHDCVENKVVVTNANGEKQESTVWNATDLGNFPIKIQTNQGGRSSTLTFKDVSRSKPDSTTFDVPSGYQQYDSPQALARGVVMKKMGGGGMNFLGH